MIYKYDNCLHFRNIFYSLLIIFISFNKFNISIQTPLPHHQMYLIPSMRPSSTMLYIVLHIMFYLFTYMYTQILKFLSLSLSL